MLLVDDEPHVLEALAVVLRRHYVVHTAESGEKALRLLEDRPVDAVVSDEQMPGMAGSELLTRIRERHPNTARLVLTGRATVQAAMRAINSGKVHRFLEKPCNRKALRTAIDEAIAEQSQETATRRLVQLAKQEVERSVPPSSRSGDRTLAAKPSGPSRDILQSLTAEQRRAISPREREVLELLVAGHHVAEIASELFISPHTVRNHLKALYRKFDVHSQLELIRKLRS